MAKIDIISGFLGAGKTTLIKKLVAESFKGEKLVIIENEFGEIGIDGGFLKDSGIQITEMNSGCICCSLVGDFGKALRQVMDQYSPDRIIIEPSGVGKLSDVIKAVKRVGDDVDINSTTTVVDVKKCKMYMKNYGEFYENQIESAGTVVLSRTQMVSDDKLKAVLDIIREHNSEASIITTPWDDITGDKILEAMEKVNTLQSELEAAANFDYEADEKEAEEHKKLHEHGHHHHHDDDEHDHDEHHHHDHDDDEHDHDHDEHDHHDHDDDEHDHHDHHHHGHHHADDVFDSVGFESAHKYEEAELKDILKKLADEDGTYGVVLRAKGIVPAADGSWFHFDLVPEETQIRKGSADYTGRVCVIGSGLKQDVLKTLFNA
ncbi:MAG: CobW family GTP-binding protein [Lachnospiraceae bacterium]|jgi:G3E family GTPase|nr:CobW family GTP-binding protein [Lachnospiraceae bacterium]MEE3461782.1 CobW family GTP-binding protein [Lachnospiraceae bacterium]